MTTQIIAILHLEDVGGSHVNLRSRRGPLETFLLCAVTCAKSFAEQGLPFLLLTDQPERLRDCGRALGLAESALPAIEHYPFKLDVPPGIRFRGAHFRLELIEAIAEGTFGQQCAILDVDAVAIAPFPELALGDADLVAYKLPDVGTPRGGLNILRDIERLTGVRPAAPCWYGGELLAGRASAFGRLVPTLRTAWDRYRADVESFHYIGSEMVWNAMLQATPDINVIDAGYAGLLARWWSTRGRAEQVPFDVARRSAILHLPADKALLSNWARRPFEAEAFLIAYERHLRGEIAKGHLGNLLRRLKGQQQRPVPHLH